MPMPRNLRRLCLTTISPRTPATTISGRPAIGPGLPWLFWVPGAWVEAPYEGALWTPGYWGFWNHRYGFYRGHWGRHVGYYGGINYGFGYIGFGYEGGYWGGGHFNYNSSVNNINRNVERTSTAALLVAVAAAHASASTRTG